MSKIYVVTGIVYYHDSQTTWVAKAFKNESLAVKMIHELNHAVVFYKNKYWDIRHSLDTISRLAFYNDNESNKELNLLVSEIWKYLKTCDCNICPELLEDKSSGIFDVEYNLVECNFNDD